MADIGDLVEADSALEQPSWTRAHASTLPASGAWRPSDPPGERQFLRTFVDRTFVLEGGGQLSDVTVAFETWGTLAPDGSNAILLCHALTGDAHAAGRAGPGQPTPGWWDGLIGPGRVLDTDRFFVVCANVLGGCQGTTGPASPRPDRLGVYGAGFPVVTVRDMVRTQARLADALGIGSWAAVVGGSMGGMQVLEWGIMFPERVRLLVPIATCAAATAQQIAYWSTGRRAIALDPAWHGGDYYDAAPGEGPHRGLAVARMISQITFRTDRVFTARFGRDEVEPLSGQFGMWDRFQVERYLEHHGDKLIRRFDANSYLLLTKAMDLHDISRGRGGLTAALGRIQAPVLAVGVSSDTLYPKYQSQELVRVLRSQGGAARYAEIDSPHGHDAFLLELEQVGRLLAGALEEGDSP
ncbi:homoserine O-acetyltransferase [Iamia majanohamensis]|uniref:Homoserine O-acetyltransferase n=1 Tax=Iamia majanohamensis TaxID=467976 RepID=A0AAF0BUG7_9ACTN|nr:homoserine O-acetyltransferase [Iamia majanohamensis]WCO65770.1 homoserine O-acetyltransferase [Iamia majanohamensis]